MNEKPASGGHVPTDRGDDTLNVPPPNFRERVQAAQKAKTSEIRQSVEIPNPLLKKTEELSAAAIRPSLSTTERPATPDIPAASDHQS